MTQRKNTPADSGGKPENLPVCIVTGLSGAGKSTVLKVLEDMGFFTVDGLPAGLASDMVLLLTRSEYSAFKGIALGMDVRQGELLDIEQAYERLAAQNVHPRLIFVNADAAVLVRRYAETRRPHPLEREDIGLEAALKTERERLTPLMVMADTVLDTSSFSIHDLRRAVQRLWNTTRGTGRNLKIHLISFGFKYGVPKEADMVLDLRFLPNPYFVETLRAFSGKESAVRDHVFAPEWAKTFRDRLLDFLTMLLPLYDADGRSRLSIGLGCTGGRHRSVALAEEIIPVLRRLGYSISLEHRHLGLE